MNIRKAEMSDLDLLVKVRFDYLVETDAPLSESDQKVLTEYMLTYFAKHLDNDSFIAFLAEDGGNVASVAFLALSEMPASPSFPTGNVGTVLNVLTYPDYRNKGIATQIMQRILSEAKAQKIKTVRLSATESGKPLYRKLGFTNAKHQAMTISLID